MSAVFRLNPLTKCIASGLYFSLLTTGNATDRHVTTCSDAGVGSLRAAISSAASSGDRVVFDIGTMNCSTITLTSGGIQIDAEDITLQGPSQSILTVDGNHNSQIFKDGVTSGASDTSRKLTVNNLTLRNGLKSVSSNVGFAVGGCIQADGDLTLNSSTLTGCQVVNASGSVNGGAAFAHSFHIYNSQITNNVASAASPSNPTNNYYALGGGLGTLGVADSVIASSVVSGNMTTVTGTKVIGSGGGVFLLAQAGGAPLTILATSVTSNHADRGGGVYIATQYGDYAHILIDGSTFSSNTAAQGAGVEILAASSELTFQNSTVSGNAASDIVGGVLAAIPGIFINDTIAFNTAAHKTFTTASNVTYNEPAGLYGPGTLTNTIVANNTVAAAGWDFSGGASVMGSNNLIMFALPGATIPADTLTADPMLAALANNGGPTLTHALMVGSPAIDAGCNVPLRTDQRGPGFPRQTGSAVDIGAFEFGDPSSGDVIYRNGFEGTSCPP